jgi:hypothetical protein
MYSFKTLLCAALLFCFFKPSFASWASSAGSQVKSNTDATMKVAVASVTHSMSSAATAQMSGSVSQSSTQQSAPIASVVGVMKRIVLQKKLAGNPSPNELLEFIYGSNPPKEILEKLQAELNLSKEKQTPGFAFKIVCCYPITWFFPDQISKHKNLQVIDWINNTQYLLWYKKALFGDDDSWAQSALTSRKTAFENLWPEILSSLLVNINVSPQKFAQVYDVRLSPVARWEIYDSVIRSNANMWQSESPTIGQWIIDHLKTQIKADTIPDQGKTELRTMLDHIAAYCAGKAPYPAFQPSQSLAQAKDVQAKNEKEYANTPSSIVCHLPINHATQLINVETSKQLLEKYPQKIALEIKDIRWQIGDKENQEMLDEIRKTDYHIDTCFGVEEVQAVVSDDHTQLNKFLQKWGLPPSVNPFHPPKDPNQPREFGVVTNLLIQADWTDNQRNKEEVPLTINHELYQAITSPEGNTAYHIDGYQHPLFAKTTKRKAITTQDKQKIEVEDTVWMMRTDKPISEDQLLPYIKMLKAAKDKSKAQAEKCGLHFPKIDLKLNKDIKCLKGAQIDRLFHITHAQQCNRLAWDKKGVILQSTVIAYVGVRGCDPKTYLLDGPFITWIERTANGKVLAEPVAAAYVKREDFIKKPARAW